MYFDGLQGFILHIIIVYTDRYSMHWGKRPYIGLLNSIVAGLGSPASTGVDHICDKARFISWLVSMNF